MIFEHLFPSHIKSFQGVNLKVRLDKLQTCFTLLSFTKVYAAVLWYLPYAHFTRWAFSKHESTAAGNQDSDLDWSSDILDLWFKAKSHQVGFPQSQRVDSLTLAQLWQAGALRIMIATLPLLLDARALTHQFTQSRSSRKGSCVLE